MCSTLFLSGLSHCPYCPYRNILITFHSNHRVHFELEQFQVQQWLSVGGEQTHLRNRTFGEPNLQRIQRHLTLLFSTSSWFGRGNLTKQKVLFFLSETSLVFCLGYLGIDADDAATSVAGVGEDRLVALDAVRMLVAQHIALACQRFVALPAAEVAQVPIFRHGFGVFAAKNQLRECQQNKSVTESLSGPEPPH